MQIIYETVPQGTIDSINAQLREFRDLFLAQPKEQEDLITRKEACEMLNVTDVTIWTWAKQGKIPTYKVGAKVYLKRSEVMSLVESNITKK